MKQKRMNQYHWELGLAIKENNAALQWRLTRHIGSALKGNTRHFAHFPKLYLFKSQFLCKYQKKGKEGGWDAIEVSPERIAELEGDLIHIPVHLDRKALELYDRFVEKMHKASNRKMTPPGENCSELWRIILKQQWLQPNFSFSWGLGSNQKFPENGANQINQINPI